MLMGTKQVALLLEFIDFDWISFNKMKITSALLVSGIAASSNKCMVKTSTFAACQEICDISSSLGFFSKANFAWENDSEKPFSSAAEPGSGAIMTKIVEWKCDQAGLQNAWTVTMLAWSTKLLSTRTLNSTVVTTTVPKPGFSCSKTKFRSQDLFYSHEEELVILIVQSIVFAAQQLIANFTTSCSSL